MGLRLIPKSVTLNTLNGVMVVTLHYSTSSFGGQLRKNIKGGPIGYCLQQKCSPKKLQVVFSNILFMAIFAEFTKNDCINEKHPLVSGDDLSAVYTFIRHKDKIQSLRDNWKTVKNRT